MGPQAKLLPRHVKISKLTKAEAAAVPPDVALAALGRVAERRGCGHFLVTSDEPRFEAAAAAWGAERGQVVASPSATRCDDGCRSVHLGDTGARGEVRLREAALALLLHSWADEHLKTPSKLSGMAAVFNPSMPAALLARPQLYGSEWPEALLPLHDDEGAAPEAEPPCRAAASVTRQALCPA